MPKRTKIAIGMLIALLVIVSCRPGNETSTALLPVRTGNLYGYISRKGRTVLYPQYSRAGCFSGGVAVVATGADRKWGYIDQSGRFVIKPEYVYATSFRDGIAFVVKEGGVPVAIDKNGVTQFELPDVQSVETYSEDLAAYSVLGSSGELWGFLGKDGVPEILPQYNAVSYFSEGLCAVMNSNGAWGYINRHAEEVVEFLYDNAHPYINGIAKIMLRGRWGAIDRKGRAVVPPHYNDLDPDGDLFLIKKGKLWGWIDKEEKEVIPVQFADAYPFRGGKLAAAKKGKKWGFIDRKGNFVLPPVYDFAFGFENGLAAVQRGSKYGFIDETGFFVIPPDYDQIPLDYYIRYFANTTAFYCAKTDRNMPVNVAYKWLSGFYHQDYYEANRYASSSTRVLIEQFANMSDMISDSSRMRLMGLMIGIKDCRQNGDRAIVSYTLSDNRAKEQLLFLVRRNNKWLVEFQGGTPTIDVE